MSIFPNSPRVLKGGIVLADPATAAVQRIIVLQYNPDSVSRTLQVQATGGEGGNRFEPLRIKGPAVETISLTAELDATDQLEFPALNRVAVEVGIHPHLAALETMLYPSSGTLVANNALAQSGTLEIAPMQAPLTLFVWSKQRVVPVRITQFSVTEQAFDPALNPIRAEVRLGMRVLTVDDLGFEHRGGGIFMSYLQVKEQLAARARRGALSELGITRLP